MSFKRNPFTRQLDDIGTTVTGATIAALIVDHEIPTPATDGAQLIFTVANAYVSGSLRVYMDGSQQKLTTDFSETTPTTFTMTFAPQNYEDLWVSYIKS